MSCLCTLRRRLRSPCQQAPGVRENSRWLRVRLAAAAAALCCSPALSLSLFVGGAQPQTGFAPLLIFFIGPARLLASLRARLPRPKCQKKHSNPCDETHLRPRRCSPGGTSATNQTSCSPYLPFSPCLRPSARSLVAPRPPSALAACRLGPSLWPVRCSRRCFPCSGPARPRRAAAYPRWSE